MSNPIKPDFKSEWFSILLLILALISGFYFYKNFPAQVATHWNLQGGVDGYSSSFWAAFLLPIFMFAIYLLFIVLPYLDPKKEQYANFRSAYHQFKDLIISFLFIIFIMIGLNGSGHPVNIVFWTPVLIGVFLILIAGLMKKIKTNWFFGIRTPWTLSSADVWQRTHELSGKVFISAGLIIILISFVPGKFKIPLAILALIILIIALPLYSFILYSREKKNR